MSHPSDAYFYHFESAQLPDLEKLNQEGFEFSWSESSNPSSEHVSFIYQGEILALIEFTPIPDDFYCMIEKLEVKPIYRNRGLAGKMLAYVAKKSFELNFEGFMLAISKTNLRNFYIQKLGGKQIGHTNRIFFDTQASKNIIKKYGGDDHEYH